MNSCNNSRKGLPTAHNLKGEFGLFYVTKWMHLGEVAVSGNLVQGSGRKPIRHVRNAKHVYVQTSRVFLIC